MSCDNVHDGLPSLPFYSRMGRHNRFKVAQYLFPFTDTGSGSDLGKLTGFLQARAKWSGLRSAYGSCLLTTQYFKDSKHSPVIEFTYTPWERDIILELSS